MLSAFFFNCTDIANFFQIWSTVAGFEKSAEDLSNFTIADVAVQLV